MKWWRNAWNLARPTNAGDAVALIVVVAGVLLVTWAMAANAWTAIAGTLHPALTRSDTVTLDLVAQRGMNLAAWVMATATIISTVLAAISLGLIWANLVEARKVSAQAALSTAAAEAAVREAQSTTLQAQELGIRQLRAYLLVESVSVGISHFGGVTLDVSVTNSGQSPARWVSVQAILDVELWHQGNVLSAVHDVEVVLWLNDIKAGGQMPGKTEWRRLLVEIANQGKVVPFTIRLRGSLRYVDVFGQRHVEDFQFHFAGDDVPHQRGMDLIRHPEPEFSFTR